MRRFIWTVTVLVVLAMPAMAQDMGEETSRPLNIYLGAGAGIPMDEFDDVYGIGLHAVGGIGFNIVSIPGMQIMPIVEYHTFNLDEENWVDFNFDNPEGVEVSGGRTTMIMLGAHGKYGLGGLEAPVTPFITAGLGASFLNFKDLEVTGLPPGFDRSFDRNNETKFFWDVGAGIEFAATENFAIFIEGRYIAIPTDVQDLNFIPVTLGVRF